MHEAPSFTKHGVRRCKAVKADGTPCGWIMHNPKYEYCTPHNPAITDAQRLAWRQKGGSSNAGGRYVSGPKTPRQLLEILSSQLDNYLQKHESDLTTDSVRCICDLVKTHLSVHDRIEDGLMDKPLGWSIANKKKA